MTFMTENLFSDIGKYFTELQHYVASKIYLMETESFKIGNLQFEIMKGRVFLAFRKRV